MSPAIRPWCAEAIYPGLKPFWIGTIVMPAGARHDEIEAELRRHALKHLPDGFSIQGIKCGALFFAGEVE